MEFERITGHRSHYGACASDGLVFADWSEAAASARGPSAANAVVAPSIGRNSRLVKPADDFESCLRFSDEAMEPPCENDHTTIKETKAAQVRLNSWRRESELHRV